MACLAVFGRGPGGGALANPHVAQLKNQPEILDNIFSLAGIEHPAVPMAPQNFRYQGNGAADTTFVCLDALCRRVLPAYLSQLDHNVAQVNLAGHQALGAHPSPFVTHHHFVHRQATNSAHHGNFHFAFGGGVGFAMYYTFGADTFNLVMEDNGNLWDLVVPRNAAAQLHWLIRYGFQLQNVPFVANAVDIIPNPLLPPVNFPLRLTRTAQNYFGNFQMPHDLANTQLLCGPCNAAKNAGGVPLAMNTYF